MFSALQIKLLSFQMIVRKRVFFKLRKVAKEALFVLLVGVLTNNVLVNARESECA